MTDSEKVEEQALALAPEDRARLAETLWASLTGEPPFAVALTPELERLLDDGLEGIDQAKTTDELRAAR